MAFFIVTGKLRSGKSLMATARMKEYLEQGKKVATNFDLKLEHMLPVDCRKVNCIRIPDLPAVEDLEALGKGSDGKYDENTFGLIVIDEGSGNFNARDWADEGRKKVIDWLKHSGKLRWDVYIIVQSPNMLDKQIREAFGEHLVSCKRMDRLSFPFIGPLLRVLGLNIRPPKVHVGVVRYGLGPNDPVVDRWLYRARNLYQAYDTEQKFDKDTSPGLSCYLPPYTLKGRYMNKFQIGKAIAAGYIFGALLLGAAFSFTGAWWIYKGSENPLYKEGFKTAKVFNPKDVSELVNINGVVYDENQRPTTVYLSDGRTLKSPEYEQDQSGFRIKDGDKWIVKK